MTRAERLRALREHRGMNEFQLAKKAGVPEAIVFEIEDDSDAPTATYRALEVALAVRVKSLTDEGTFASELNRIDTPLKFSRMRAKEARADVDRLDLVEGQVITYQEAAVKLECSLREAMARVNAMLGNVLESAGKVGRFRLMAQEERWGQTAAGKPRPWRRATKAAA
jgi:transcriptional regulator with XRE-family HTH domain